MNKLLVICGPTATGKTSLGIRLAKRFAGEIISADSRQVYRGMDIGTGKDINRGVWRAIRRRKEEEPRGYWEVEGVPIHLLDVVEPNQEFSVAHYYRLAWSKIRGLWQKSKLPLLVGGSGFYIRNVVDGVDTREIPRNPELRVKIDGWSAKKLFDYLAKLDPEKVGMMNKSDRNNPRRLVRAIEVAIFKKENPSWRPPEQPKSDSLFIGLKAPRKILYQRIDKRVDQRLAQSAEEEVKRLLEKGYTWKGSALGDTMGYQEWRPFFDSQATKKEVIKRWQFAEHDYARRQMTWFGRDKRIRWFDITQKGWQDEVESWVKRWYHQENAQES
ncbi:MAG TPA: tRNA (adenosine(37)-N6)-dimethylallyltransferase MiaA [Nevskiaceae bacterium]|nr:tRNA (adenosine(37)-N6)-dimethylallyltransferase MiaA [Nevskiaceae bacterium]